MSLFKKSNITNSRLSACLYTISSLLNHSMRTNVKILIVYVVPCPSTSMSMCKCKYKHICLHWYGTRLHTHTAIRLLLRMHSEALKKLRNTKKYQNTLIWFPGVSLLQLKLFGNFSVQCFCHKMPVYQNQDTHVHIPLLTKLFSSPDWNLYDQRFSLGLVQTSFVNLAFSRRDP